jgi:hypothetical protein
MGQPAYAPWIATQGTASTTTPDSFMDFRYRWAPWIHWCTHYLADLVSVLDWVRNALFIRVRANSTRQTIVPNRLAGPCR